MDPWCNRTSTCDCLITVISLCECSDNIKVVSQPSLPSVRFTQPYPGQVVRIFHAPGAQAHARAESSNLFILRGDMEDKYKLTMLT